MPSDARSRVLDAALGVLRAGDPPSLDAAARAAGLTKPGVMYHFPTKEALMLALVDRVVDRWEAELGALVGRPVAEAGPQERVRAYVAHALDGPFDPTDVAMLADPRLRAPLAARWTRRLRPWVDVPDSLPDPVRGRLVAARLLADGLWLALASGILPPSTAERELVRAVAADLLGTPADDVSHRAGDAPHGDPR